MCDSFIVEDFTQAEAAAFLLKHGISKSDWKVYFYNPYPDRRELLWHLTKQGEALLAR